jgi:hypothetical protein
MKPIIDTQKATCKPPRSVWRDDQHGGVESVTTITIEVVDVDPAIEERLALQSFGGHQIHVAISERQLTMLRPPEEDHATA